MTIPTFFLIAIIVLSVVIHEVAHGYAALALGDPTAQLAGRLTLNPLRHLDWFGSVVLPALLAFTSSGIILGWAKPVPYNPYNLRRGRWGPALVAAAGPASNLALATVFALLIRLAGAALPSDALGIIGFIVLANVSLAIFNLLPFPPLDGSKILFALLPYRWRGVENFLTANSLLGIIIVLLFLGNLVGRATLFLSALLIGWPIN